jgi:hypothetical protein
MKAKVIKIKASCGSGGCSLNPFYVPKAEPKKIFEKNLVKKAA